MEFQVVHKGIDSLYMSFWGVLKPGLLEELEEKKSFAKSDDLLEQALATKSIGEHSFEVMDRGKGKYSYVIVDNWFHIQISSSRKMILPTVYVQISSELLNCLGLDKSVSELRSIVNELMVSIDTDKEEEGWEEGVIKREQVSRKEGISRADIFVDFVTDMDFESVKRKSWVTWAEQVHKYWTGAVFTGWTVGQGGVISARLYDKTVEIMKSHKGYFIPIWQEQGWQAGQRVLRLEFELKKEFLTQMSINKIEDLLDVINDIWRVCTHEWLRLAIDDGTENRTRWANEPVWDKIQQVSFGAGAYTGVARDVSKSRVPSDKTMYLNGLGYLLSYQVAKGYENTSEAIPHFLKDADEYLKEYTKASDQYTDAEDYKRTKINLKKKRFNKK